MSSCFVSYSSEDEERVAAICSALRGAGYAEHFFSPSPTHGIPAGVRWEDVLWQRLRQSQALIFFATRSSTTSDWCQRELGIALFRGMPVVVAHLEEDCDVNLDGIQQLHVAHLDAERIAADVAEALLANHLTPATFDPLPPGQNPFPGLAPFDASRSTYLFGREGDTFDLVRVLLEPSRSGGGVIVHVTGTSGVGKSSFVAAAVVPTIAQHSGWDVVGSVRCEGNAADIEAIRAVIEHVHQLPDDRQRLLVIDQAELLPADDEAPGDVLETIFDALAVASLRGGGRLSTLVVSTPSSRLQTLIEQRERTAGVAIFPVRAFDEQRMRIVVDRLVERAGIEFPLDLRYQLIDDAAGPEALPLVGYALQRLWHGVDGTAHGSECTLAAYTELGGLDGMIASAAERASPRESTGRADLRSALIKFVARTTGGQNTTVAQRPDVFTDAELRSLEEFRRQRLVIDTEDGRLAIAHDALVRAWPWFEREVRSERVNLDVRRDIALGTARWMEARRERDDVAPVGPDSATLELALKLTLYDDSQREYVSRCQTLAVRERRIRRAGRAMVPLSIALVVASVVLAGFVVQNRELGRRSTTIQSLELAARAERDATIDEGAAATAALAGLSLERSADTWGALLSVLTGTDAASVVEAGAGVTNLATTQSDVYLSTDGVLTWSPAESLLSGSASNESDPLAVRGDIIDGGVNAAVIVGEGAVHVVERGEVRQSFDLGVSGVIDVAIGNQDAMVAILLADAQLVTLNLVSAEVRRFDLPFRALDIDASPDDGVVAAVSGGSEFALVDVQSGAIRTLAASVSAFSVQWNGGTQILMAGGEALGVHTNSLDQGWTARRHALPGNAVSLSATRGVAVVALGSGDLAMVSPSTGEVRIRSGAASDPAIRLLPLPDGVLAQTSGGVLLDVKLAATLPRIAERISVGGRRVATASGSDVVATVAEDGRVRIDDGSSVRTLDHVFDPMPDLLVLSPAGNELAVIDSDGTAWSLGVSDQVLTRIGVAASPASVVGWSAGRVLAGLVDGSVVDVGTGSVLAQSDSALVTMASEDDVVAWMTVDGRIWAMADSVEPMLLGTISEASGALSFGQDSILLAGTNEGHVEQFDVRRGSRLDDIVPGHTDKVTSIAVVGGEAERWLVTASEDETLRVTRYGTGEQIGGPVRLAQAARFTAGAPVGSSGLLTETLGGEIIIWTLDPNHLIELACDIRTSVDEQLDAMSEAVCSADRETT